MAGDECRRHRHIQIVLTQKRFQHFGRFGIVHMHRKVRSVTQVAATAHHGQVDASFAALHFDGEDVHVLVAHGVHRLLVQHFGECTHLVTQLGGLFKLQLLCMRHHARFDAAHHLLRFTAQQAHGAVHIALVVGHRNQPHTWP